MSHHLKPTPTMRRASRKQSRYRSQSGQILIEYILLLMIGLTIGNILIKTLTANGPDQKGIIIERWQSIWKGIGEDYPDKVD